MGKIWLVKQLPSYRTRSATLPRSEPLPTTTTGHYTICCKKKPQSYAPEDGQKFARNMLSWSWRSIKLLLLHLVGFYITLPTFIMHGQTQIKILVKFETWKKNDEEEWIWKIYLSCFRSKNLYDKILTGLSVSLWTESTASHILQRVSIEDCSWSFIEKYSAKTWRAECN